MCPVFCKKGTTQNIKFSEQAAKKWLRSTHKRSDR